MIKTFRDRDTDRLYHRRPVHKLPTDVQRVVLRKFRMLDAAEVLGDLRVPPGNRLEKLRGDRAGQHSIRINTNGGSASAGSTATPMTWSSSITTRSTP